MIESTNITSTFPFVTIGAEPFADYQIESKQPGPGFYSFILIYTLLSFLLIAPLVSWSRNQEEKKLKILDAEENEIEVDQQKNPEHQKSSTHDNKQRSSQDESKTSSFQTGKENFTKNEQTKKETYSHGASAQNGSTCDLKRENKKQSSTSLNVLKKFNLASNINTGRPSPSSICSDRSDALTKNSRHITSRTVVSTSRSRTSTALRSAVLRELDQSYPDQDPDFQNRIALRFPMGGISQHSYNHSRGGSNEPTEKCSSVPSAATTGKIHQSTTTKINPSDKGFSKLVLDVGGRRWKNRRPIGRADVIENVFASNNERQSFSSIAGSKTKKGGSLAPPGSKKRCINPSNNSCSLKKGGQAGIPQRSNHQRRTSKGISDIASSILSEQHHQLNHQPQMKIDISAMKSYQLEQLRMEQQYQQQHQMQLFAMQRLQQQQRRYSQQRRFNRFGTRGVSERSLSVMSSIVDDISPDDAADADDPGRGNIFIQPDSKFWMAEKEYNPYNGTGFGTTQEDCCSSPLESLFLLAAPDVEKWNVFQASIPLAFGASSEALFRLVTIAIISQHLGTKSMIAFLLVGLFVRLTSEELSSAIIDSLSSFVQASMDKTSTDGSKSNYIAGQYIQLAFIMQVVLNIPLLVVWVFCMESFVMWMVADETIAKIALGYASIVVFAYMVQALSRTLTAAIHICGHEHFESVIDLVAAALQVIVIACVLILVDGADLTTVGGIQVLINVASAIAKIAYPAARGWMAPFRKGLIQNVALWNYGIGIWHLIKAAGPLLLGTLLEYGEWELLTLFVQPLGPAEVATWALLGAFWDFFEALTEGIGEAAANQITYLLSTGQINSAKKLCYGAILMAVTQAVLVTSVLFMLGQYLAVLFTTDPTIQHLMNNTIVLIGFANTIMSFSQITWSLIGAQGRFRLATFVIFFSRWVVTMPCALVSIYMFNLDLNAMCGSLVLGYATACCALTVIVLRSDWDRLSRLMQVMNQPPLVTSTFQHLVDKDVALDDDVNNHILGLVDVDNFDDSDDDSDGFGFGDYDDTGDDNEDAVDQSASS